MQSCKTEMKEERKRKADKATTKQKKQSPRAARLGNQRGPGRRRRGGTLGFAFAQPERGGTGGSRELRLPPSRWEPPQKAGPAGRRRAQPRHCPSGQAQLDVTNSQRRPKALRPLVGVEHRRRPLPMPGSFSRHGEGAKAGGNWEGRSRRGTKAGRRLGGARRAVATRPPRPADEVTCSEWGWGSAGDLPREVEE